MQTNEGVGTTLKVLITGSAGFVGTETRKMFTENGIEFVNYDIMDGNDIRNYNKLRDFVVEHKPNRILHLAAIARFAEADANPLLTFETNHCGTSNVVAIAKEFNIPLVYASTGSVYMPITEGTPILETFKAIGNSQYACSKLIGEKLVMQHNPHIILRYAHIYGREKRGHGLIGGYYQRIQYGLKPMLYGGEQSNDFCYVTDIAQANMKAVMAPWDKWNNIYNIGTGEELTAVKAGEMVCEVTGWKGGVDVVPGRTVDPMRFVYDITKAKVMLGYEPKYDFKKGLEEMFK